MCPTLMALCIAGKGRGSWLNEADNISLTGDSDGATSEAATVQVGSFLQNWVLQAVFSILHWSLAVLMPASCTLWLHMKLQLRKVSSLFCVCTKRRLLLGAVATLALGGFALVPTDYLRLVRPSKPLFLYLVPLLRVRVSPNFTVYTPQLSVELEV